MYEERLVLKSKEYGRWFQSKYHYLVTKYFGSEENSQINLVMTQIAINSLEDGTLNLEDFYQDDFYLIEKIEKKIDLKKQISELTSKGLGNESFKTKERKVDPEILVKGYVRKLSIIDQE